MKRIIGILLALTVVLVLGSCNFLGSIVNPIIGSWETNILGVTVSSTFNADHSFTDTNSLGNLGVTESGTWTSDDASIIKTWSDDSTTTYSYSFNSDKSEMTLSNGAAITYSRQ